ncbi:G-protein coupled receptor Mth2-like [Neocloeon triangulifer]|uniref:G-protein coupled receptor Mth2-like n=1 Tax=Neocloeon triangulifer TaxID=2078957 RepID=UPI00286EE422|nr:G-protein coupled receptor Mth2-like [Neocloeon triangulifer]
MRLLCLVGVLTLLAANSLSQDPLEHFSSRCCPIGEYLGHDNTKCVRADETETGTKIYRPDCNHGMYLLNPNVNLEDLFTERSETGDLELLELLSEEVDDPVMNGTWCAANPLPRLGNLTVALVCFEDETEYSSGAVHVVYGICIFISCIFFALTLAVYVVLPELRDTQGLCLMANILSLIFGYFMLSIIQLFGESMDDDACVFSAFFLYYWLLSAFFWLGVVSFNVWRNIVNSSRGCCNPSGKRKFIAYTLYGWGGPLILLLVIVAAHYAPEDYKSLYRPRFGHSSCWFHGPEETWLYFYGPISLIICANIYFFVSSALHIWRIQDGNNGTQFQSRRFKWMLYLKLFIVMGITWIFEVASFAEGSKSWFWYITDVLNCLQGLFFFLILICRQRVLRIICARPWGYKMFGDRFQGTPEELDSDNEVVDNAEVAELANSAVK